MKRVIFGIFAHPDDEAFGPCGALIKAVKDGAELHLITLTSGEAGQNPDHVADLGEVRDGEWREAGRTLGAFSMYNLKLRDGHLNNITMQLASKQIVKIISDIITSHAIPVEAEIMTFDPNGLTGHIDHVVASRLASFVFYTLKDQGLPMTEIHYYCHAEDIVPAHDISWIYADKGHSKSEIDETINARAYRNDIIEVMRCHYTQRADYEGVIARYGDNLGINHFIVRQ